MRKKLAVILSIVALDAIGVGLAFPILPGLLRWATGRGEIGTLYGVFGALFAAAQFLMSPVLGALSDRYGRRPILLLSMAGAAVDYAVMASTHSLWLLLVGRAVAGMTSGSLAVAGAYVADVSDGETRGRRLGYISGAFGIGFMIGPALGGLLGARSLHAPFVVAALFALVNFALTWLFLPESRPADSATDAHVSATDRGLFRHLRWAVSVDALRPMLLIYLVISIVGNMPSWIWILYGHDRFQWTDVQLGLSLTLFGACQALAQAFVTGPAIARFGELTTVLIGIACDSMAMVAIGVATTWWVPFLLIPVLTVGGIYVPALQALMSRSIDDSRQGELQGVLASITSVAEVAGCLLVTSGYTAMKGVWIGGIWIVGASLYVCVIPLTRIVSRRRRAVTLRT